MKGEDKFSLIFWIILSLFIIYRVCTKQKRIAKRAINYESTTTARGWAVDELDPNKSKKTLVYLATYDISEEISRKAINLLWDEKAISFVAIFSIHAYTRADAIKKLDENRNDILLYAASFDNSSLVSTEAIMKLQDQESIAIVAISSMHISTRSEAIYKLDGHKWNNLLLAIINNTSHYSIRSAAIRRLDPEQSKDLLIQIAKDEKENIFDRYASIDKLLLVKNIDIDNDDYDEMKREVQRFLPDTKICNYCYYPSIGYCKMRRAYVCENHKTFEKDGVIWECY